MTPQIEHVIFFMSFGIGLIALGLSIDNLVPEGVEKRDVI